MTYKYQHQIHPCNDTDPVLAHINKLDESGWEIVCVYEDSVGVTQIVVRRPFPYYQTVGESINPHRIGEYPSFSDVNIPKPAIELPYQSLLGVSYALSLLDKRVAKLERQNLTDKLQRAARTEPVPNKSGRLHMASELEPGWDVMSIDPKSSGVFKKWRKLEDVVAVNDPEGSLCLTFEGGFRYYFSLGDSESNAMIWKVRPVLFRASELEVGMTVREYGSTQYPTWCTVTSVVEDMIGYMIDFDHRPSHLFKVGDPSNDEIWEVKNDKS